MRNLSLIACGLLLSSSALFAESNSIKEAFANGTTSGDLTVYHESVDKKDAQDTSITAGSIGLNYETDTYNGVSISLGARAQHEFHEKNDTDYEESFANDAVMHTAAIKYANSNFFLSVGRQEIDLEWLGDYNESVVAGITAIPDTTIVLGYTDRQAEIAFDTTADFEEITEDGAYVLDVKYEGVEGLLVNPYAYTAPDEADFYGLKVSYDTDMFGVTAHYAASNQDSNSIITTNDGEVYNLEARLNIAGVSTALGYIGTDKDGSGSIAAYGDNMNPMDEATYGYGDDEETVYGSISYEVAGVALTALYAETEVAGGDEADEFNFIAEYSFTDELSAAIVYVDNDTKDDAENFEKVFANVTYSF